MNRALLALLVLAACGLSAACPAQTPASTPSGGFQPLAPYAVDVCLGGRHRTRANVVGQVVTSHGTFYEIDTRRGRLLVSQSAIEGLPCVPRPERRYSLPANVHRLR